MLPIHMRAYRHLAKHPFLARVVRESCAKKAFPGIVPSILPLASTTTLFKFRSIQNCSVSDRAKWWDE